MPIPPPSNAKKMWQGSISTAWEWPQTMFDGSIQTFECLTRPDAAVAMIFLDEKTVLLTKQEQPARPAFIDFPGGRIDEGEEPLKGCQREVFEETGYTTADINWKLFKHFPRTGIFRYEDFAYLMKHPTKNEIKHVDAGEKIELYPVGWNELVQLCLKGKLRQVHMMHAVLCMEFDPAAKAELAQWLQS